MGITIHYGATLNKNKKYLIPKILNFVEECAVKFGYEYQRFDKLKGYVETSKIYNQNNELTHEWESFWEFSDENDKKIRDEFKESHFKETDYKKKATQQTIIIHNKVDGEYMSESFSVGFYLSPFSNKYEWSGFTKTQVFNEKETIPNLKFHIFIIKVLQQIKLRFIENIRISDEADFFFTEEYREEQIKSWEKSLKDPKDSYHDVAEKYLKEWKKKKPYDFKELVKSHVGNLKVIESVGIKLSNLGYKEENVQTPINNGINFLEDFYNKISEKID